MSFNNIFPDKIYFSIGEVSEMFEVNASMIRYWEKEFDILNPKKNKKGKEKKNEGLRCTEIADKINLVIKPLIKIDDSFNNSNKMHKIGSGQAKQKKNKKKIENESGFNNEDYYEPKYICNCFEC